MGGGFFSTHFLFLPFLVVVVVIVVWWSAGHLPLPLRCLSTRNLDLPKILMMVLRFFNMDWDVMSENMVCLGGLYISYLLFLLFFFFHYFDVWGVAVGWYSFSIIFLFSPS